MILILIVVFILTSSIALHSHYYNLWNAIPDIPGPKRAWLIGNLHQVGTKPRDHLLAIFRWMKGYQYNMFRIFGGPQPYVIISDPKNIETVLSSTQLIYKNDPYTFFEPWLGQGLLTANGQHWVKHRKAITPSFHFQILKEFLSTINEATERFINLLNTYAEKQEVFDIQYVVKCCTMDVICETAMGIKINTIENVDSPIPHAMEKLCYIVQERVFSLLRRSDLLFQFTKANQTQKTALKVMEKEISKIIEYRRNNMKIIDDDTKRPKMAFLDNLLSADIDGKPISIKQICDEVNTFLFEGHDTTAVSIAFTAFCLSRHPEIQQKVFEEQYGMFGDDLQRQPTYQELKEMPYLESVIKESLRLFPSVPIIFRTTTEPTELDGCILPKGVNIGVFIISLGTNPNVHKDPYKFKPERFLFEERNSSNSFSYVPFSAGPRNCIGQKFAMMELKVVLSKMIRHFTILPPIEGLSTGIFDPCDANHKVDEKYDPILEVLVTLKSANGLLIRLKKRTYQKS